MNPVLLKPSADTSSQVIVMGRYDPAITRTALARRGPRPLAGRARGAAQPARGLRPAWSSRVRAARPRSTCAPRTSSTWRGAGVRRRRLPGRRHRPRRRVRAPAGTWMCLAPEEQALVRGFVLNKFRGDPALLGNAMDWLRERTGVPTVAIVPMLRHPLPEEDAFHHRAAPVAGRSTSRWSLYPYASNLDEFDPLIHEPGVTVVPIREPMPLDGSTAVLLPGSKNTAESLRHLRASGLAAEIARAAAAGVPCWACAAACSCSGARPRPGRPRGRRHRGARPARRRDHARSRRRPRARPRSPGAAETLRGYEIHHGRTAGRAEPASTCPVAWAGSRARSSASTSTACSRTRRTGKRSSSGWAGRAPRGTGAPTSTPSSTGWRPRWPWPGPWGDGRRGRPAFPA